MNDLFQGEDKKITIITLNDMRYRDYSQVEPWKKELVRKIGLFGLKDLRKITPVGDLGYANGWYWNWGGEKGWMYGDMEKAIMEAFREQGFKFDK